MSEFIPPTTTLEINPNRDFPVCEQLLIDCALGLCAEHHSKGLLFVLYMEDPESWNNYPGNAFQDMNDIIQYVPMPALTPKPQIPANYGTSSGARELFKLQTTIHNAEVVGIQHLKRYTEAILGPVNCNLIGDASTLRATSVSAMLTFARDLYGACDDSTIKAWTAQLMAPHDPTKPITETLGIHKNLHDKLRTQRQPLSEAAKISMIDTAFESLPGVVELIRDYKKDVPVMGDRTFAALMEHLIQRLSLITTGSMGYTANAALAALDVEKRIADAFARGRVDGARGRRDGRSAGRGRGDGRGRGRGIVRLYCYVHGYDSHNGVDCHVMKADPSYYLPAYTTATSHVNPADGSKTKL